MRTKWRVPAEAAAVAVGLALILACSGTKEVGLYGPAVVLTGCLHPGDAPGTFRLAANGSPNGMVGTTGQSGQSGQSLGPNNPTGTAAKSYSSDIGAPTTRIYELIPGKHVDLGVLQGSIVQVVGHLETSSGQGVTGTTGSGSRNQPGGGLAGSASAPGNNGANAATGAGPQASVEAQPANRQIDKVRVDSVHRVSGPCSGTR